MTMQRRVAQTCWGAGVLFTAALVLSTPVSAQTGPATSTPAGPAWTTLSASERQALQPLQAQWNDIDSLRKQKWRDVAARYAGLPLVQQERLHERMVEWATMTPVQRNMARISFEELRKLPATERQTRWDAYQSLPAEQRLALSTQASRTPAAAASQAAAARKTLSAEGVEEKSNIVTTQQSARPQSVAPGTVQAGVGASTRPISKPPTPPRHQQAGMPKIAATPEFVQDNTLLPQRGPQGAGIGPLSHLDTP
ncbi:DUF3106 domain-containing protein [Sphaerotilus sp.]|uniref:DUF3106 domain-containing protein n=1 Tax=Sphaerotilus sp. TaxID=2093942 RepID=UPI0025CD868F|nr:DUF3106 domain-containing protein [Sphaerotilus sp.]